MEIRKPTISDFTNANHTHSNTAGAGALANDLISYAIQGAEFKGDLTVTASDIDWTTGFYKAITLTGNTTYTFSNLEKGKTIALKITGSFTLGLPVTCKQLNTTAYDGTKTNVLFITCLDSVTPLTVFTLSNY